MSNSSNLQLGRGAKLSRHTALLCTDFGMGLLRKKAGKQADRIIAKMSVYTRGKNAGKPKGCIQWTKTIQGGFDYVYGYGVVRGGSFDYRVGYSEYCEFEECDSLDFDNKREKYEIKLSETLETWAYAEKKYRHFCEILNNCKSEGASSKRIELVADVVMGCKEDLEAFDSKFPNIILEIKSLYAECEI